MSAAEQKGACGIMRKKLPVGIEFFEDFSKENFYYIDKTMFIAELLQAFWKDAHSGHAEILF